MPIFSHIQNIFVALQSDFDKSFVIHEKKRRLNFNDISTLIFYYNSNSGVNMLYSFRKLVI